MADIDQQVKIIPLKEYIKMLSLIHSANRIMQPNGTTGAFLLAINWKQEYDKWMASLTP